MNGNGATVKIRMVFQQMGTLKKYWALLKVFFQKWKLYGFSVAFSSIAFPLHHLFSSPRPFLGEKKHAAIFRYLLGHYSDVVHNFAKKNIDSTPTIDLQSTIWVCWWDGYESMPPLVKTCYSSIKQHAGTHPVQLITKHNFRDFISIPDYILEKVDVGIMSVTHFSNIIRANLLYEHGGIWMDATIFVIQDILLENVPFYTLKAPAPKSSSVTLARFAGLSNPAARISNDTNPQTSRWYGFLLAGTKGSIVFEYMREILYAYWKDHDNQIDYVLYDYTIALGYEYIPVFKELVDNVPCSVAEKFAMEKNLNREFSEEEYAQYCKTPFHKLTWKNKFVTHTKDGKLSIYGYLLEQYK